MITILFCENRNKFFQGESKDMSHWTSFNDLAKNFTLDEAAKKVQQLKFQIRDSEGIMVVPVDFKRYK